MFLACLDPAQAPQVDETAQKAEADALSETDPEAYFQVGRLLAYCGQKDAALRLLKSAVEHNYCSYTALQTDPLLAKLRGTREMSELLSDAKQCQNKFLAQAGQNPR
jgi:predicted negative regulator of RcsB-dependent stress response